MAKVCEYLGLAVNLKVKLESICAEVFSVSAIQVSFTGIYERMIMFVEVNHVTNKKDY